MSRIRPQDKTPYLSTFRLLRSAPIALLALIGLTAGVVALTGCGLSGGNAVTAGSVPGQTVSTAGPGLTGIVHGGPNPVSGATVSVFVTSSNGYGMAENGSTPTAQTTTDSNGNFDIGGSYGCPAGQFAYLVAAGGNTGGNTTNANAVLVSALGRCDDLYSGGGGTNVTYTGPGAVIINEITTIAAAYALGPFSSVSGSGASTVVQIGSDASNNAPEIGSPAISTGCIANAVMTVGVCGSTTVAAGLAHAFQNAANLVNSFPGTGTYSAVISANLTTTGATANATPIVPQQLINSIGNILVACVNSSGGTANDGSACGDIFKYTTLTASTTAGSGYIPSWICSSCTTDTPTNTFSAMVNLAANPTLGGNTTYVTDLFNVANAQTSVYSPDLTTAPTNDYSIAISYPGTAGGTGFGSVPAGSGTTGLGLEYTFGEALDVNDNLYVGNNSTDNGDGEPVNILSLSSNGTLLGTSPDDTVHKGTFGLAVDGIGNGYFGNDNGSGTNVGAHFSFTTGSGGGVVSAAPTNIKSSAGSGTLNIEPYAFAIDRANNVWAYGIPTSGSDTLYMSTAPASSSSFTGIAAVNTLTAGAEGFGLAIDPQQNVWVASGKPGTAADQYLSVVQNTGTLVSPTYNSSNVVTAPTTPSGDYLSGITFAGTSSSYTTYVVSDVNNGGATPGVQPFTPALTAPEVTGITNGTLNTGLNSEAGGGVIQSGIGVKADGAGIIWIADSFGAALDLFNPANSTAVHYKPCVGVAGGSSTTCTSSLAGTVPYAVVIDSAGSVWVTTQRLGLVEFIGAAAPTWPLLSLGAPGMP